MEAKVNASALVTKLAYAEGELQVMEIVLEKTRDLLKGKKVGASIL